MTAHYSGTTLDAQIRYAQGTKKILENHFKGNEQDQQNVSINENLLTLSLKM